VKSWTPRCENAPSEVFSRFHVFYTTFPCFIHEIVPFFYFTSQVWISFGWQSICLLIRLKKYAIVSGGARHFFLIGGEAAIRFGGVRDEAI
jgi:hypothetical protein